MVITESRQVDFDVTRPNGKERFDSLWNNHTN